MDTTNTSTQLRAGFFVLLGLLCIGSLVIYFGRFGESVKKCYTLTVEYRNASGLLKGADVLLSGAKIGEVAKPPSVLPNMRGVAVVLNIDQSIQIPEDSIFSIGSSGLLGDRYVTVTMKDKETDPKPIAPGSVIKHGQSESSISELQRQIHDEVMPKLVSALGNIDSVSESLKQEIFNKEGVANLQATLGNLAVASASFKTAAGDVGSFLKKGDRAMDSLQASSVDLKAFIANLKQHGIIFYRDTAPQQSPGPVKKKP
jgi:phospholipid/cholesterol/gamma-HCH transport system substrate-binding protein